MYSIVGNKQILLHNHSIRSLSSATYPLIFMQLTGQNNGRIALSSISVGEKMHLTGQNLHNEHA